MASARAVLPHAQAHYAQTTASSQQPAAPLHVSADRGRAENRERRSPSRSLALAPAEMGAKSSKPVLKVRPGIADQRQPSTEQRRGSSASSPRTPTTPINTAYGSKKPGTAALPTDNASICRSPTWSPRGSLAARTQADRDRRDRERELRKEAEEAKKRLKDFKDQGRRKTDPPQSTPSVSMSSTSTPPEPAQPNKLQKKAGRRLSKQPPPAAMETQRMPAALRMERQPSDQSTSEQQEEPQRRRRSSSIASMMRLVTGRSNSTSGSRGSSRRNSVADDDKPYMSDASTKSKSSFIGGVKLRQQQKKATKEVAPTSPRLENGMAHNNGSFANDMQAQIDKIAGRPSQDAKAQDMKSSRRTTDAAPVVQDRTSSRGKSIEPPAEVNANMGRRRSQKMDAESKPVVRSQKEDSKSRPEKQLPEEGKRRSSISEQLRSSREASLSRMQNLVTPLRSAMKGGRQTVKGGRTQSMPVFPGSQPTSPQAAQPSSNANYVHRARLHSQSRSLAGWHDEMAVQEANELAAARAADASSKTPTDATAAASAKPNYGPQMPPTPEESVNESATPRASHDTVTKTSADQAAKTLPVLGAADKIVWKQPIKANRSAAAERADLAEDEPRIPSDIDKLPSQAKSRQLPESSSLRPAGAPVGEISGNAQKIPSPTSPLSSDDETRMLRRHPAVMSWKAEKQSSRPKFSPEPVRSSTMPVLSTPSEPVPIKEKTLRPEDHPSLAALRSPAPESVDSMQPNYSDPIDRPFSIIPTPVASPAPTSKSRHASKSPKPVVKRKSSKTKSAASKAIDALKERQAEQAHEADASDEEPSLVANSVRAPEPLNFRRHSTPPTDLAKTSDSSLKHTSVTFPFPDRHEPLIKPSSRPPPEKRASANKVTFHTPPESPRFLNVPTSYDSYRRNYSHSDVSPGLSASDVDDDVQLPVPVSQLAAPNPPFAREGRKTPSPNGTPKGARSQSRSRERGNKGYVYVNFSPVGSSSTVNLGESASSGAGIGKAGRKIPKGFVIKNADGAAMDPVAKLFVVCCGCRKWHDVPSNIYKEMAKGLRVVDDNEKEKASAETDGRKQVKRRKSGIITRVPCCWCQHEMSVMCCEGWSTLCYMSAQYHAGASASGVPVPPIPAGKGKGQGSEKGRVMSDPS